MHEHNATAARVATADPSGTDTPWNPLLDRLGLGEWRWERGTAQVALSARAAALLGLPATTARLEVAAWLDCVLDEDRDRVQRCLWPAAHAADEPWDCEFQLAGAPPRRRVLRGAVLTRDADGAALCVAGTLGESLAAAPAPGAPGDRERLLGEALEQAQIAWFERDLDTEIGIASPSIVAIYGLENRTGPWHYDEIRARVLPEDLKHHRETIAQALSNHTTDETTRTLQYRIRRPDGELRHLEVRFRHTYDGGRGRAFGLIFDVTETKELELKFEEAMEYARMAWFERDLATDTMRGSRSLWQIYGVDPAIKPLTFDVIQSRMHPDDRAAHPAPGESLRNASRALRGAAQWSETTTLCYRVLPTPDDERWIEVRYRTWLDGLGGGTVSGLVVDVTATKQAEIERDRLHRQLQQAQKMEAIGLLTGGIAHDFNNILASILGYSGLALQRFSDRVPEKLIDYLKEVQIAGGRARDLVSQMLAFSRGESGELVSVPLSRVVEQSLQMLRPTLPSSIDIATHIEPGLPAVLADPVQLQQVVLNLCINARDAMAGSGNIQLSLERRHVSRGHCASCHHEFDGSFLVLSVSDDGPGIPESTQARIFEPFFSTKASGRGTGMGLAMVHGIVHRHQGHILLDTAPDAGCTFAILVPIEPAQILGRPAGETIDIASYEASTPSTVLVVDDERAVASFVGELLELHGYRAVVETDPNRAWALFEAEPQRFDLVVTDQTMPRLSGVQLATRVMATRADMPVVLMTGYSATVDERRARELGIRAYLRKPVKGDDLLAAIANALERRAVA
ncbi:MAG: ATP-binding protein [Gammaproteobacteria bacterium]